jgi:hypothetical protein
MSAVRLGAVRLAARLAAPVARHQGPALASGFVRQAFDRAVDGLGPLQGAAQAAEARLDRHHGDPAKAVRDIVDAHVRLAGAQGFLTNLGGLLAMTVTVPANVAGLALVQAHMVGGIAHLRGYDLEDPRVRNAVLACMMGGDKVGELVEAKKLPTTPMAIATAPAHDPQLDNRIAAEVASELLARIAGKRTVAAVGRRLPVVGGGFGMVTDGYSTYQVGRYAARELKSRNPRAPRGG